MIIRRHGLVFKCYRDHIVAEGYRPWNSVRYMTRPTKEETMANYEAMCDWVWNRIQAGIIRKAE